MLNGNDGVMIAGEASFAYAAESLPTYDAPFIAENSLCIAEAFVKFAVEQGFDFWKED